MNHSKLQNSLFLSTMAILMVVGMNSYHFILQRNFSYSLFFKKYIILLLVALLSITIINRIVSTIAPLISTNRILIRIYMVIGIVTCMTILGTIMSNGFTYNFLTIYLKTWLTNFVVALPLQLLLVGPITKRIIKL